MKNKIYNAIQKGLSNVLIFDDNDSTLSYQKSNINNETKFPKVSLDELYDIFKENPDDIFGYNTKDCVSLILDNNSEISLHEYKMSVNPVFLKISNDILKNSGNEIIIACNNNHYINYGLNWQTEYTRLLPNNYLAADEKIISDFDGRLKCQLLINKITKTNNQTLDLPAIKYCNNIKSPLINYKGYLPAIGQLNFILKYLDIINYIFKYFKYNILDLASGYWWSSSEYSRTSALSLFNGNINYLAKVDGAFAVLPLFAFEK